MMTHIERRKDNIELMMKIVGKCGLIRNDELAAQVSFHTGTSLQKCFEYIKVAVLAGELKLADGLVELAHRKDPPLPSA